MNDTVTIPSIMWKNALEEIDRLKEQNRKWFNAYQEAEKEIFFLKQADRLKIWDGTEWKVRFSLPTTYENTNKQNTN